MKTNVKDLIATPVNHGTGIKKVFISNNDTHTALTQFAWSRFEKGGYCEEHQHATMDEYFYVSKGRAQYTVDSELLEVKEGDFLAIPAGKSHRLIVDAEAEELELIYFGIDTAPDL